MGSAGDEEGHPAPVTRVEVSVVVVSYNTRDLLRRLLVTVAESGTSRPYEILVVDNASVDGSAEMLTREHPDVRLIANDENVGYSRAVNQAIRAATGRYVLILNPDIEVLPGAIDALARHLEENPKTGIAGGKLLNPDGTLQYSCRTFYTLTTLLHRRTPLGRVFPNSRTVRDHLMMDWDHDTVREVDWMLGACLMVRREAIVDVGLMDERFFMYFEDVDWCYRMKQHEWKVEYVPHSRMLHMHRRESARGGGLANTRLLAHLGSMFRFFDKWNTMLYRLRKNRDLLMGGLLLVGDVIAVNVAFLFAFGLRSVLSTVLQRPVFSLSAYGDFVLLMNGVVLFVNFLLGLYLRPTTRDLLDDAFILAKGLAFSTLVLMASTFLTGSELHSRFMVAVFLPLAFGLMLAGRSALGTVARTLRRSRFDLVRTLVVGERRAAGELAEALEKRPALGHEVVATLPDRPDDAERRFRLFWESDGIREIIRRHRVSEVLLVRPTFSDRELVRFVLLCRREGVRIRLISGAADFLSGHVARVSVLGRPAVDLGWVPGRPLVRILRRAFDLVVAGVVLMFLGPKTAWRARRPVDPEESHEKIHGLGGKVFWRRIDPASGAVSLADTLGHVLRGELALVGPRPLSPETVAERDELRTLFDLVRPGATGPWRLNADENLTLQEEVSLSVSYLQYQSPLEDLKIVLRTLALTRPHPDSRRSDT
jgi:GT2 family glycosyltransferase